MEYIKIPLIHNLLLLMEGASQVDWQVNVITVINVKDVIIVGI